MREKQEMMMKSPKKLTLPFAKWVSDLEWRLLLLIIPPLFFLTFFSFPSFPLNSFSSLSPVLSRTFQKAGGITLNSSRSETNNSRRKDELVRSRMAVCLVGGARRFELTGPSILEMILKEYPNADLFLHSPLDPDAFKFSLLKNAPRIAAIRIFHPRPLPETDSHVRVLTAHNSPHAIQGLLQYFNLVEGCLTMIKSYQQKNNFTYDWIVRTRVDGYWNAPLRPENFVPGQYTVPLGSSFGGLNDRLGIGDLRTSTVALSRLSLIPQLDSAGFTGLNSEAAFKAQLTTQGVRYFAKRLPFCIVSDRKYGFPPARYGVPVAGLSSPGPLSGAKCRPCTAVCRGGCVEDVMVSVEREWGWTHWGNGTLELCDARESWENGWEKIFDGVVGAKNKLDAARMRKRIGSIKVEGCLRDFREMGKRAANWDAPPVHDICTLGLGLT